MPQLQLPTDHEVIDHEAVSRGPDWLFVKMTSDSGQFDQTADRLWSLLNRHFVYRLVLEMQEVDFLPSILIGQLVMLHKRVLQHGGAMRLCGLSAECQQALHFCRLDSALPNYATREEAVNAQMISKPR